MGDFEKEDQSGTIFTNDDDVRIGGSFMTSIPPFLTYGR
jgi:hypothetical protein